MFFLEFSQEWACSSDLEWMKECLVDFFEGDHIWKLSDPYGILFIEKEKSYLDFSIHSKPSDFVITCSNFLEFWFYFYHSYGIWLDLHSISETVFIYFCYFYGLSKVGCFSIVDTTFGGTLLKQTESGNPTERWSITTPRTIEYSSVITQENLTSGNTS